MYLLSRIISLIWVYLFLDDEMAQIDRVSSVTRFEDYLSAPVPSAIPSPELQPSQNVHMPDLMNFGNPGKCLTQRAIFLLLKSGTILELALKGFTLTTKQRIDSCLLL